MNAWRPEMAAKQRGKIRELCHVDKTMHEVAHKLGISIASVSRLSRGKPNSTKVTKH